MEQSKHKVNDTKLYIVPLKLSNNIFAGRKRPDEVTPQIMMLWQQRSAGKITVDETPSQPGPGPYAIVSCAFTIYM